MWQAHRQKATRLLFSVNFLCRALLLRVFFYSFFLFCALEFAFSFCYYEN